MDNMEQPVVEEQVTEEPAKKPNGFLKAVGFDAVKKKTTVKTEIIAGIVTFLAMAYILTVNPAQILVDLGLPCLSRRRSVQSLVRC